VVFTPSSDNQSSSPLALLMRNQSRSASSSTVASSNGRFSLGERVLGPPIPVFLGRSGTSNAATLITTAANEPLPGLEDLPVPSQRPASRGAITAEPVVEQPIAEPQAAAPTETIGEPIMLPGVERVETPAAAATITPKQKAKPGSKLKPGAIADASPRKPGTKVTGTKPAPVVKKKPLKAKP
jgi:hypothetical protein